MVLNRLGTERERERERNKESKKQRERERDLRRTGFGKVCVGFYRVVRVIRVSIFWVGFKPF